MDLELAPYPGFVVDQLADAFARDRGEVVQMIIEQWIVDHVELVDAAGASLRAFREEEEGGGWRTS